MARSYYVAGEVLVQVKSHANSALSSLTTLGVAEGPTQITFEGKPDPILTDPTGKGVPTDYQTFGGIARINMGLIHFDKVVLEQLNALSQGGTAPGTMGRAGQVMGNGLARLASGWLYFGMNLTAPVGGSGFNFKACLVGNQYTFPLGTEKTVAGLSVQAIPYVADPASGLALAVLWNNTLDS